MYVCGEALYVYVDLCCAVPHTIRVEKSLLCILSLISYTSTSLAHDTHHYDPQSSLINLIIIN